MRRGEVLGYGYQGHFNGPFALPDENYFLVVLNHTENEAAAQEQDFEIDIPLANRVAVDHMLRRGHQISPFIAIFMADATHAQFKKYILTSPPFFILSILSKWIKNRNYGIIAGVGYSLLAFIY